MHADARREPRIAIIGSGFSGLCLAIQLRKAGINVNLAPVADTVPTSIGTDNQPIGRWGRQFSSDPGRNSTMVSALPITHYYFDSFIWKVRDVQVQQGL